MAATAKEFRVWLEKFPDDTPITALMLGGDRYPVSGFAQTDPLGDETGKIHWRTAAILLGPRFTYNPDVDNAA